MSSTKSKRPRVWVPGTLWVSDEGELCAGAHVGWNGSGKAFAAAKLGHSGSVRDWRHRAWLVERSQLTDTIIERHAIIIPETLLDPDEQPHARRWLAGQPLLCVSGGKVQRLVDDGLRVYTVEHGVEGPDVFGVSAQGGERASWSLSAPFTELLPPELRPDGDPMVQLRQSERLESRTFIDRLLQELSRGALRELSVVNALAAYSLVEPGYGYRGATDGTAAAIEVVAHALHPLDDLFAQVFTRARKMRDEAKEIAREVLGAPDDAVALEGLPIYGGARRVDLEPIAIALGSRASLVRAGESQAELVLPAQARWFVERVDMWRPKLSVALREAAKTAVVEPTAPDKRIAIALMAVLAVIIAVGYAMTH